MVSAVGASNDLPANEVFTSGLFASSTLLDLSESRHLAFIHLESGSSLTASMASHSLAIAKASLAAGLIRPDPIAIPKSEVTHFYVTLEAMLRQCSTKNIQV